MAVTNDITANVSDIHPINKRDVGKRLALWALAKNYGQSEIVYSGPLYKSVEIRAGKIEISFDHVGSGLKTRDGNAPDLFEIAGSDKVFYAASAKIVGDKVLVWSEKVGEPTAVRFAWSEIAEPNLMNKDGLPASSFRINMP
jgi:sialate O-acetylesterase